MTAFLQRLAAKVRGLVGTGKVARLDDSGPQQRIQLQVLAGGDLEQVIDQVMRLGEYGLFSVPPLGAEVVVLYPDGRRASGGVIIATGHRDSRPKAMQPGEAGIYNGLTGAVLRMGHDGKAYLNCDLVVTGAVTATGDIEDHSADGKGATMETMRQTYDSHTHPAGTPNTGVPNQQLPD